MSNYSKLIGTVVGFLIGMAVTRGVLPAEWQQVEYIEAITLLISAAIGTWGAPKNLEA
jgi:high-affinity Fe2+/Pb2+ permease